MTLLVYGAYGYTGRLVVEAARERGLSVTLAGRDPERLAAMATPGEATRSFALRGDVTRHVRDHDAVLNCAGPFADTFRRLVEGCLAGGTDYLDVTGELEVLAAVLGYDEAARAAGVRLLPGVGFDVVPTDCLAAILAERLPEADHLELAFAAEGGVSPGTAATVVRQLGAGGRLRRDGRLVRHPFGHPARTVDLGAGDRHVVAVPWGDLATAEWTTGIGNVTTYTAVPPRAARLLRLGARAGGLVPEPVRRRLADAVAGAVSGPDARARAGGRARVWGEVRRSRGGRRLRGRLETPETYTLTARAATEVATRVLAGGPPPGAHTPAGAFGPDLVTDLEGVRRSVGPVSEPEQGAGAGDPPAG